MFTRGRFSQRKTGFLTSSNEKLTLSAKTARSTCMSKNFSIVSRNFDILKYSYIYCCKISPFYDGSIKMKVSQTVSLRKITIFAALFHLEPDLETLSVCIRSYLIRSKGIYMASKLRVKQELATQVGSTLNASKTGSSKKGFDPVDLCKRRHSRAKSGSLPYQNRSSFSRVTWL